MAIDEAAWPSLKDGAAFFRPWSSPPHPQEGPQEVA